jgi:tetratricopeptide (TPR) repeat protein
MIDFDICPPMDINSEYERGFQLRCEGNYGEAKAVFQSILMHDPDHVKARLQFGLVQGFVGDFDGSLATLSELSVKNPGNLDVRYGLAMTQMMLGMYEEGCANLKQILAIDPNHEEALRQSAYC